MKIPEEEFQQGVNYKKIIRRFLDFKKLYIVALILFVIGALIYNKVAEVMYQNSTTVLISEKGKSILGGNGQDFFKGMNMLSGQNNIDNEVEVLSSFSLSREAIQNMDIEATVYSYEKTFFSKFLGKTRFVQKKILYKSSPLHIIVDPTHPQAVYLPFEIQFLGNNTFKIIAGDNGFSLYNYIDDDIVGYAPPQLFSNIYHFGDKIETKYFSFKILKSEDFNEAFTKTHKLFFYLNNTNAQTYEFLSQMTVEPISQNATILKISLRGDNFHLITDFLNQLTDVFLDRDLKKKNNAATSTVSFIDAQISEFQDSLSHAENTLKNFRTSHQVMDLSYQGQQVYSKLDQLQTQEAAAKDQLRYFTYLKNYFDKNKDVSDLVAPSSSSVVDPILTNLVSQLITLNNQRASMTKNNTVQDNIMLKDINLKIENLKRTILENVKYSISTLTNSISELDYRIKKISNQISTMPKTELQLKGIERKFDLNNQIYTFLLQKRAEAQIAKASSMPDYEVVEPAKAIGGSPVTPKKMVDLIVAIILALVIPSFYILIIDFFNNKIRDIDEIESMTNNPILGKVFRNFRRTTLVVAKRPNSSVSESFRSIRTNFQFFSSGGKKQVVVFTSSASGDGKTFCSINFASALALNGHRTALLEFDLRRPKVHQEFGSSNMIGISSYLIDKAVIDDIIVQTEIPNLDLISAGPAAPNPAELIASDKTGEFLETLKEMYDYIIIDSAPVGIVSETYLLMKHSDVNIFVVRLESTVKDAFRNALKGLFNNGFSNFSILINDLNIKKESFKYGYDTKYYHEDSRGFLSKIFSRSKSA